MAKGDLLKPHSYYLVLHEVLATSSCNFLSIICVNKLSQWSNIYTDYATKFFVATTTAKKLEACQTTFWNDMMVLNKRCFTSINCTASFTQWNEYHNAMVSFNWSLKRLINAKKCA